MAIQKDPFRQFQEELAALERSQRERDKEVSAEIMPAPAKKEFLDLRDRYKLTVADVVAFFPEEEGIAYLQGLIAASGNKSRRTKKY